MKKPTLIILQGHPCTGKTRLLAQLGAMFALPAISRDEFKELLFDRFGAVDREWSMKLGGASFDLFFAMIEKLIFAKASFIIETNFDPARHRDLLAKLVNAHDYEVLEVLLEADPQVILHRFKHRWESGERHRGHVDHERYADLEARLNGCLDPLGLGQRLIRLNTSDYNSVDWTTLFSELDTLTGKQSQTT